MGLKYITVSDALTSGAVVESSEVINLRTRLEGLRMGLQFAPRNSKSYHVYREGNPYCMGWIGYDDFQHSNDTPMYAVYSYNIENEKYSSYSDEHHMRMTKNVDTAIRNVKKYLRVLSPHQLVKLTQRELRSAISDVRDVLVRKYVRLPRRCSVLPLLIVGLTCIVRCGTWLTQAMSLLRVRSVGGWLVSLRQTTH